MSRRNRRTQYESQWHCQLVLMHLTFSCRCRTNVILVGLGSTAARGAIIYWHWKIVVPIENRLAVGYST